MFNPRSFAAFGVLTNGVFAGFLLLCGCERTERISTYSVPKHESLQTPKFLADHQRRHPKQERMIAVVIPREEVFWFFKLQGDVEAVAARENDVREFLKTVRILSANKIDWTLPANWRQLPASEMRYATLVMDGNPPLEISVSQLPVRPDMPIPQQVENNINRWRNQLSLPAIEPGDLNGMTEQLPVSDSVAYWINIVGHPMPKPPAMARPQGAADRGAADRNERREQNQRREAPKEPVFETPEGWVEGTAQFAAVAFKVTDDEASILVTVTPAAGDRLANVNRWRGQLKLPPLGKDELEAAAKKVAVGPTTGEMFEMTNDGRTILGVIVDDNGQTWFIKLAGDAGLAERERSHFVQFLQSLNWK